MPGFYEQSNEGSMNDWELLHQVSDYKIFKGPTSQGYVSYIPISVCSAFFVFLPMYKASQHNW
jgi:hypothetical protein